MKKILLLIFVSILVEQSNGQCVVFPVATAGSIMLQCSGGTGNRSGVAYNPAFNVYYSVNAGSGSYPIETFSSTGGTPVNTISSSFDYRGLWWNPNTSQLTGNGYGSLGVALHTLNGSGYATGATTPVFSGMSQPSAQSCGAYDYNADEIIHYANTSIYRYNSATGAFLGLYAITGLPVPASNIDSTSLGYTGCIGLEICLYDYVNKAVYFINKATGAYVSTTTLPASAAGGDRFMFSFSNNMIWVFNSSTMVWQNYVALSPAAINENPFTASTANAYPNPSPGIFTVEIAGLNAVAEVEVYDLLGNVVLKTETNTETTEIDLGAQPRGIYFWKAVTGGEMIGSGKVVTQ